MAFLAGLFLGLCLLLFADTAATQSLGEVHKISLALRRRLRCVARRDQLLAGNSTGENVKVVC